MTDHEFLKLLKDKKVADAYQYYDSSRYKLALARISYEALDKIINNYFETGKESIQKVFSDAIETGKGEYRPHSESVNFCGIEIGVSTAMNKLTMEILSLLHNFFGHLRSMDKCKYVGRKCRRNKPSIIEKCREGNC